MTQPDKDLELKGTINALYHHHTSNYGYRRITIALCSKLGLAVNEKKIRRLMKELGLKGRTPNKKRFTKHGKIPENILQQDFKVDKPGTKLATDVTEFLYNKKKYYLSPVIDLFNGEIITYTISNRPRFQLIKDMLNQAISIIEPYRSEQPILHSDQGGLYRVSNYRRALENANIIQSMSGKGNCYDNAVIESFFSVFKREFFNRFQGKSECDLHHAIKENITYYNNERIKLRLKMSPVEFRTQYMIKHAV